MMKEKRLEVLCVSLFFILILVAGLIMYKDYGISWDEPLNLENGLESYNYVFSGNSSIDAYGYNDLGVAFELPLVIIQKSLSLNDSRDIYLMRHLFTFLFCFAGIFFFYLLCKRFFSSWKLGLFGSLLLVLSPRIFSNFFYNSKDAVFLSAAIIVIYSLLKFLEKRNYLSAFIHALACAFIIDIRIIGLIFPFITILMFIFPLVKDKYELKKNVRLILFYGLFLILLTIAFWPWLWQNPLNFFDALTRIHSSSTSPLYFGKYLDPSEVPWHYIPVWILITTPLLYLFGFFAGLYYLIKGFFKHRFDIPENSIKNKGIILLWLIVPLLAFFISRSVPYDSWRHLFFIYPAILIIAVYGIREFYYFTREVSIKFLRKILPIIFIAMIITMLLFTLHFMIVNHPNEGIYFNIFAGNNENIKTNFDMDYWGLSYRQALEYVLSKDNRSRINIAVENMPGIYNSYLLTSSERARLNYVQTDSQADYLLTEYRWHKEDYNYPKFYSVKVGGLEIMTVYRTAH